MKKFNQARVNGGSNYDSTASERFIFGGALMDKECSAVCVSVHVTRASSSPLALMLSLYPRQWVPSIPVCFLQHIRPIVDRGIVTGTGPRRPGARPDSARAAVGDGGGSAGIDGLPALGAVLQDQAAEDVLSLAPLALGLVVTQVDDLVTMYGAVNRAPAPLPRVVQLRALGDEVVRVKAVPNIAKVADLFIAGVGAREADKGDDVDKECRLGSVSLLTLVGVLLRPHLAIAIVVRGPREEVAVGGGHYGTRRELLSVDLAAALLPELHAVVHLRCT